MMRLRAVDRLLDFFEENVDLEHIKKIEELNYQALCGREVPFLPLTIRTVPEGFDPFPLEDAFDDPEKMLYNELLSSTFHSAYNSVRTKDHCALQIRSKTGIGKIPLWLSRYSLYRITVKRRHLEPLIGCLQNGQPAPGCLRRDADFSPQSAVIDFLPAESSAQCQKTRELLLIFYLSQSTNVSLYVCPDVRDEEVRK